MAKKILSMTFHINPDSTGLAYGQVTCDAVIGDTDDTAFTKNVQVQPALTSLQIANMNMLFFAAATATIKSSEGIS